MVSSVFGPFVFLSIRNHIIHDLGIEQAGYWETMTRISTYYLMFASTILSVYFLPKLSKAQNGLETKNIFLQYYKYILPVFVCGLTVIYLMRFFIIRLLFTKEFLPVTDLFFWQLLGDIFKIASLILGYQLFAKKKTSAFILSELFSLVILYFFSLYFIRIYGIEGVVIGYALDNFIYFLVLFFYFRSVFKQ